MTAGWRGDVRKGPTRGLNSAGPYLMCSDKDVSVCLFLFFSFQDHCTSRGPLVTVEQEASLILDLSTGYRSSHLGCGTKRAAAVDCETQS